MSASISRYLKDFSAPKIELSLMPPKYFAEMDDDDGRKNSYPMAQPQQPKIDLELERRAAFAEGREEAEAEMSAAHARAIADLTARYEADIEAIRTRCENEIAAMIYDRYCDLGSQLATMLCDQTARVLAPVMDEVLLQRSIADLARMITQSIGAGEGCKIVVKGPTALFEALENHLNDETLIFRHVETDDIDLTVEFGDSILVTRMAAWSDTVKKVLA